MPPDWSSRCTLALLGTLALALAAGMIALDTLLREPTPVLRALCALLVAVGAGCLVRLGRRHRHDATGAAPSSRRSASSNTAST
jgi:hypothetical protein